MQRYEGMSGRTQGERKVKSPAKTHVAAKTNDSAMRQVYHREMPVRRLYKKACYAGMVKL
jgi:hypothetical protein